MQKDYRRNQKPMNIRNTDTPKGTPQTFTFTFLVKEVWHNLANQRAGAGATCAKYSNIMGNTSCSSTLGKP